MQTNNEIEEKYKELRKKYKLPEFKEIDFEFEISDFEKITFLLRSIIRGISEKLDFYATLLEEILQPDASNLYAMHETRFFDENEKEKMYNLYRKLMDYSRQSIIAVLEHSEKNEAEFINNFFNDWKIIKQELLEYIKVMQVSWRTESDIKEDLRYLG